MNSILDIERRWKEVTGLTHLDLSVPHFSKGDNQQQKTTKQEYKDFGFVTTPLWLVDEMLEPQIATLTPTSITCDACSGCGQFSIRLMRKFYDKLVSQGVSKPKAEKFITQVWLSKNHWFTEYQFSNVAKLLYIFGNNINVYVGDTRDIKYSNDDDHGFMFFINRKWVNLPIVRMSDNTPNLTQQLEPINC